MCVMAVLPIMTGPVDVAGSVAYPLLARSIPGGNVSACASSFNKKQVSWVAHACAMYWRRS